MFIHFLANWGYLIRLSRHWMLRNLLMSHDLQSESNKNWFKETETINPAADVRWKHTRRSEWRICISFRVPSPGARPRLAGGLLETNRLHPPFSTITKWIIAESLLLNTAAVSESQHVQPVWFLLTSRRSLRAAGSARVSRIPETCPPAQETYSRLNIFLWISKW